MHFRTSLLLCLSTVAVAGVLLNCSDDETAATTPLDAGRDVATGADTAPPPPPDGGSDTGTDAAPTGRTVYAVNDVSELLSFNTDSPGMVTKTTITGVAPGETIHGIDFRPKDGTLYALGSTGAVYTIAPASGAATSVAAGDAGITTFPLVLDPAATSFGFDFNPPADRIRVHTNTGKNYRLHPADGRSVNAAGDPDLGTDAGVPVSVVATAYTNSVTAPTATKLYGIDAQTDQLLTFAIAPGFADATMVGALGVDAEDVAGFDIYGGMGGGDGGIPAVNIPMVAYAALRVAGSTGLYTIDLATGKATLVGAIGHEKALRGIAVQP
jgi:hypothetical protein